MPGNRLQVWEINSNPDIFSRTDLEVISSTDPADAERKVLLSQYAEHIAAAFAEIDVQDGRLRDQN